MPNQNKSTEEKKRDQYRGFRFVNIISSNIITTIINNFKRETIQMIGNSITLKTIIALEASSFIYTWLKNKVIKEINDQLRDY